MTALPTTAPLGRPKGLSHLAINVSDLERSRAFYATVLGFEVFLDKSEDEKFPRLFGTIAGVAVELIRISPPGINLPSRSRQLGLAGMVFSVDNLDATCAELFARGLVKVEKPKMFEGAKVLYVGDPDGSYFELIEFPSGTASPQEAWGAEGS